MTNYIANFFTNRRLFAEQFKLAANNLVDMAAVLQRIVNLNPATDFENLFKQVDHKENIGGNITHKIYLCLNKITFAPIGRPGIHALASGMGDIAETIREAAGRMYLYHIEEFSQPVKELTALIFAACVEIQKATALLFAKKTAELAIACCQIKNYEHDATNIYYGALGDLFSGENDAIKLLKHREILLSLDASLKKCKAVTDVFNAIIMGNN